MASNPRLLPYFVRYACRRYAAPQIGYSPADFAHREGVPEHLPDIKHLTLSNPLFDQCNTFAGCRPETQCDAVRSLLVWAPLPLWGRGRGLGNPLTLRDLLPPGVIICAAVSLVAPEHATHRSHALSLLIEALRSPVVPAGCCLRRSRHAPARRLPPSGRGNYSFLACPSNGLGTVRFDRAARLPEPLATGEWAVIR